MTGQRSIRLGLGILIRSGRFEGWERLRVRRGLNLSRLRHSRAMTHQHTVNTVRLNNKRKAKSVGRLSKGMGVRPSASA